MLFSRVVAIHGSPGVGALANEEVFITNEDEKTGHVFLSRATMTCWLFAYIAAIFGFALTSWNLFATQVSAEICNLKTLTDSTLGPQLQEDLWPSAHASFQQTASICMSGELNQILKIILMLIINLNSRLSKSLVFDLCLCFEIVCKVMAI